MMNGNFINDKELIKAAQKGNSSYQNILYDKYKKILTKYIKEVYNINKDVEDIVSDILVKIFVNLEKFDYNKSDFNTWVFNIAKNHIIDLWRKNKIDVVYDSNLYNEDCLNVSMFIDFSESSEDHFDFITKNIKITKKDMNLLEMKYVYGFSYEDMSCYSEMSASTIANRVNYVKSKIKPLICR
jgi:RNA polymerase sigma-70 factor, ECF subfamily